MSGSGPAGELTYADVRRRLTEVARRLGEHMDESARLAADEVASRGPSDADSVGDGA